MPNFPLSKPAFSPTDHGETTDEIREIADAVGYRPGAAVTGATTATPGQFVRADATSGAFTVTLPASGRVHVMKIDASANAVTVVGAGSTTINGQASATITEQWAGATFIFDGSNWLIRSVM